MSTNEVAKKPEGAVTLSGMLAQYKSEITKALPRHISPDRMLRMAMTSARKTPGLLECTPDSFLGAVIQCAQLGLEPDTPMGHGALIPFYNSSSGKKEVQFMPMYRGLMDLVHRGANHPILDPTAVYEPDLFRYVKGSSPRIEHEPKERLPQHKITHVYCIAQFADGRQVFRVMTLAEVEKCRARSKSKGFSPWQTDYEAMALKTVIRQIVKYLPMSAELQIAVGLDEMAERGEPQKNDDLLKEGQPVRTKRERVTAKMEQDPDGDTFESTPERMPRE